jgi:NAD(P)-dependent dehydrogenase (short-subunit alcohol dehydrogenase family)
MVAAMSMVGSSTGAFAVPGPDVALGSLFDFSGRAAVVTGAGHGIGAAISRRLAGSGASIVVVDMEPERATELCAELDGAGRRAVAITGDVRQRDVARRAVEASQLQLGGFDVLVNCAGIYPSTPILELTEEQWDEVIDTNLKSTFLWSQEAGRSMAAAGHGGVIVNISSRAGIRAIPGMAAYSSSKGGVTLLTQSLAMDLAGFGIRVNAVAPGPVLPSSRSAADPQPAYRSAIPAGRFAVADDIALAVAFLASPASSFITGATLVVDGGATLP